MGSYNPHTAPTRVEWVGECVGEWVGERVGDGGWVEGWLDAKRCARTRGWSRQRSSNMDPHWSTRPMNCAWMRKWSSWQSMKMVRPLLERYTASDFIILMIRKIRKKFKPPA